MATLGDMSGHGNNSTESISGEGLCGSDSMLLFTKFLIPIPPSDCISRILLIDKLEEITSKKLSLISAPAGYGKSTLLSMWLSRKGASIHTAWVSLDEKDNSLNTFWKYIIMAIEKSVSGNIDNYEPIECSESKYPIDILISNLLNRLYKASMTIVLVLDDYHFISDKNIHDSMQYLINHLPLNVHIVITSRTASPFKLARLRCHGSLLEMNAEDLKLDLMEVSEFLNGTMKLCIAEDEARKLRDWTEGWLAALNLTALAIKNGAENKKYLNDSGHVNDHIVEYLSEEVFCFLPPAIKDFLLKTSILDLLTDDLCNTIVGIDNSEEILSLLEKGNVFINALDSKKISYKYHSLFKAFLKKKLFESYPEAIEALYLKASNWYEKNRLHQKALDYSLVANNFENTARLVVNYGEIMIINRDLVRVASIIETLPKHLVVSNSKICALYTTSVAGKNDSGKNGIHIGYLFVDFEENIFCESVEDLLLIKATLAYANEDYKTALEYCTKILENSNVKNTFQCLLYKILIQIYCITGVSDKAEACLDLYISALKNKNHFDDFFIDMSYTHAMVHILCGVGKYKRAFDLLKVFKMILNIDNMHLPVAASSIYLDLGYLHYEYGEMECALDNVNKCIEISSIKMDFCRLISGYVLLAKINRNTGNYTEMMKYMVMVDELCSKYNARIMIINLSAYIVRTLLEAGDIEYAEYYMRKYKINIQDSYDVLYEEAHLALADIYIQKRELNAAEELLNRLYEEVIKTERNLSYVRIMILKSLLLKYKDNDFEALVHMKAAIERGAEQEYISTFADFGKPVAEIIREVIKHKDEIGMIGEKDINYSASILSHIEEPQQQLLRDGSELVEHLSKREFEVIQYLFKGLTNREIASILYIEECTVKKHINNIYKKIGVANRDQAIEFCVKLNQ